MAFRPAPRGSSLKGLAAQRHDADGLRLRLRAGDGGLAQKRRGSTFRASAQESVGCQLLSGCRLLRTVDLQEECG